MAIRTPKQALVVANGTRVNVEGTCQRVTRGYYLAPSAGDVDGDGDADAYDGWLSEPRAARHVGDRNPPAGYPVAFKGGSKGHGHRAISLGGGRIRSTDFDGITKRYRPGVLGNGTIAEVEHAMGVVYIGWSETIDGLAIPKDPVTKPEPKPTAPPAVHTHFVNGWNDDRTLNLHDISAIRLTGKQPYADAANVLHDAIEKAVQTYYRATD